MHFDIQLGFTSIPAEAKITCREAVRGIALNQEKQILMVHNSRGDYKFPGGGVEAGEDHVTALLREFREETGYTISESIRLLGVIVETKEDSYDPDAYFVMKSYYYCCQTIGEPVEQCLDAYEQELHFEPVCLPVEEAYLTNQQLLDSEAEDMNGWVERETMVLKLLIDHSAVNQY